MEILNPINSNEKKALPSKFKESVKYKNKSGNVVDFIADGQYYKSPLYAKDINPFEFKEHYKWECKSSIMPNFKFIGNRL